MKAVLASTLVLAARATSACSTLKGAAIGGAGVAAATSGDVKEGAAIGGGAGAVVGTVAD